MAPLINREKREEARRGLADRRKAIVVAAGRAFAAKPFGETSLAGIGRQAAVPEGTAELLFGSREQLFLDVLAVSLNSCCEDLLQELRCHDALEPAELAPVIARVLARHERLTRLASQLGAAVESVSDPALLWHFTNRAREGVAAVVAEVSQRCPTLGAGRSRALPMWLFVLAAGLEPLAHASGGMAAALIDPVFRDYAVDFETELAAVLGSLLR
jgi:AcrR family transcriptional regulator